MTNPLVLQLMRMLKINRVFAVLSVGMLVATATRAAIVLDPVTVNGANYDEKSAVGGKATQGADAVVLKLQILLDRAHFSPGVIDGRMGDNTVYALREFEKRSGLPADGRLDQETWHALSQGASTVLVTYEVTAEDIAGPFAESIPEDYAAMANGEPLLYQCCGAPSPRNFTSTLSF